MSKFNDIISSGTPTLIDYSANWCQPCKLMQPILKDVKRRLGEKVRILKIDVDKNPAIAKKHNIRSVPTLLVIKSGKVIFRQTGVMPSDQIVEVLNKYI